MFMSNFEAVRFALTPGAAESLERQANDLGNLAQCGVAKSVKYKRNLLYVSAALTAIATIGAILAATGTALQFRCMVVAVLSAVQTILSAKMLYDVTAFLQPTINLNPSRS
jgi:hypothetical protein